MHTDSTATVLVQMLHYVSVYHRPCASYHVTAISRNAASRYQCQVSDGAQTATDDVRITVLNNHPVAIAGPDRNVKTDQPVRLNGSNSFDPDGDLIAYAWSLQAKPARSKLTNAAIKDRTLPNPSVVPDIEGVYVFHLVVADGQEDSPPDFVTLAAYKQHVPPNADAGDDQHALVGDTVPLDGRASDDPDHDRGDAGVQYDATRP